MRIILRRLIIFVAFVFVHSHHLKASVTQIPGVSRAEIVDRADTSTEVVLQSSYGEFEIFIHYNKKHHHFVGRVIEILKADILPLIEYYKYAPEVPLHILINGAVNQSNGSATSFPRLTINLFDYPPAGIEHLNISGDWLRNLLLHEMVHILHLSQIAGVNKVINYLFGAGRLMPMIVPRWFTEGVAVWSETKFTEFGRLRNPAFVWETKRTFLIEGQCNGAGCVDTPGHYPFRSYPYWAGAHFMHHLEKKRPGTISCLVKANSSKVPFFLNASFEECIGMDAETAYRMFHMEFREEIRERLQHLKKSKQALNFSFMNFEDKQVALQLGFEIVGKNLIFNQNINRDPFLLTYNLENRKSLKRQVNGVLRRVAKHHQSSKQLTLGTQPFRGDLPLDFLKYNVDGKLKKISSKEKYIYLFNSGKERYGLKYAHMEWRLFEISSANKTTKDKLIYIFPKEWQVYSPQVLKGKKGFTFLYYDVKKKGYFLAHFKEKNVTLLTDKFSVRLPIYDQFRCGNDLYFRNRKSLYKFQQNNLFRSTDSMLEPVYFHRVSNEYEVQIFRDDQRGFYYRPSSCLKFSKNYSYYQTNLAVKDKPLKNQIDATTTSESRIKNMRPYYAGANLGIDYWLLAFNFDRDLFNTSLETSFTDPATNLSFNLRGIRYWTIDENGYQASTGYRINNNWTVGLSGSKFYANTGFDNESSFDQSETISFGYTRNFGRFNYLVSTYAGQTQERDFLSFRESKRYGVSHGFSMAPKKYNEFMPRFSFFMSQNYQETLNRTNFFSHSYALDFMLKYSPVLTQHFYSTYSKMHKRDFRSGILYAGLYNDTEVLGVPTNDLFGNEIMTARTQLDYRLGQFFKKDSLFPWFTRELRVLMGAEWFKSDFGILNQRFFGRNSWLSAHAGFRLQSYMAYLLPIDVDLLYTATQDPANNIFNQFIVTIQTSWWP